MSEEISFYMCECGSEAVVIGKYDTFINLAMWRNYGPSRWRHRLRHIWHILKEGRPYLDAVMLERGVARELATKLIEMTEEK